MNHYDNQDFFEKYAKMARSRGGLKEAGEWATFEKIMPDLNNKSFLDLGCGYGWHCQYAIDHGANLVVGVDCSTKMLSKAKEMHSHPQISYIESDLEKFDFEIESFDVIFSSLCLHYIEDFNGLIQKISKALKQNGEFLFSIEHPIFTASGPQEWYGEEKLHWPVDHYFNEGKREAVFLDTKMIKFHHTLTTLIESCIKNGLSIQHVIEPTPLIITEEMIDELRRPMMLIISTKKVS